MKESTKLGNGMRARGPKPEGRFGSICDGRDQAAVGHNEPVAGAAKFNPRVYGRIFRVHGT